MDLTWSQQYVPTGENGSTALRYIQAQFSNHAYKGLCQFSCTQAKQLIDVILRSEVKNADFFDKYKKLEGCA